mmetsp:Transcript_59124/g.152028  ORF Transcript_59124/g.152028 Transcript_59124/m.152028 type:complete len:311 (+) Transcript_59124:706-1638(+)
MAVRPLQAGRGDSGDVRRAPAGRRGGRGPARAGRAEGRRGPAGAGRLRPCVGSHRPPRRQVLPGHVHPVPQDDAYVGRVEQARRGLVSARQGGECAGGPRDHLHPQLPVEHGVRRHELREWLPADGPLLHARLLQPDAGALRRPRAEVRLPQRRPVQGLLPVPRARGGRDDGHDDLPGIHRGALRGEVAAAHVLRGPRPRQPHALLGGRGRAPAYLRVRGRRGEGSSQEGHRADDQGAGDDRPSLRLRCRGPAANPGPGLWLDEGAGCEVCLQRCQLDRHAGEPDEEVRGHHGCARLAHDGFRALHAPDL